jgi:hypothetical protein
MNGPNASGVGARLHAHFRSNIVGYVALFLALTVAPAIAVSVAPRNSVTSKSIKNGQVKVKDLGANAVDASKLKDNSVTGAEVDETTLDGVDANTFGGVPRERFPITGVSFGAGPTPEPPIVWSFLFQTGNESTIDIGFFMRLVATDTADEFQICNPDSIVAHNYSVYVGGGPSSTSEVRKQISLAPSACSTEVFEIGDNSDFRVMGARLAVTGVPVDYQANAFRVVALGN